VRKVFNTISIFVLLIGAFIAILPTVVIPDLIYPHRIDSAYVAFHRNQLNTEQHENGIYFNPGDLNLAYESLRVQTFDSITLQGWYIPVNDSDAATLVIIHDVNESKIKYLNLAKQMHDRGVKVFLYDLRAHGNSEGLQFSPGLISVNDVKSVLDSLETKAETAHIILMGMGIGAGIAIQAAALDYRCKAVIAQCPYNDFSDYVHRYAKHEWQGMTKFYTPVLERELYLVLQYRDNDLVLSDISASLI
jgi:pimeloyl-ACP methyl ester carboxylesterase